MAKKGLNLNPGANASLVTAATRAGLASAPPDYSKTFQNVSANYDRTMQANAQMWGGIASSVAKVGVEITKNLQEPEASQELQDVFETEQGKLIFNDIEVNNDALKRAYGFRDKRENITDPNNPGETIPNPNYNKRGKFSLKEIRRLTKERNDLYAYAESSVKNITAHKTLFEKEAIHDEATGLNYMQQSNALIATTGGKTTDLGMYWMPAKNKDGKYQWSLYHDSSKVKQDVLQKYLNEGAVIPGYSQGKFNIDKDGRVIGADGNPIMKHASEFRNNLVLKQDVQNETNQINKDLNSFLRMGTTSKTAYSELNENQAAAVVKNYGDKRASWFANSWGSTGGKSFYERVNAAEGSQISAELFTTIGAAIDGVSNKNFDGTVEQSGIFKNVKDVEGTSKGITIEDLQQDPDNYKILTLAMFNTADANYDPAVTAKVFRADLKNQLKKVYNDKWATNPNNIQDDDIIITAPFSNKQNYGDNIMGSNLNVIWDAFNKGEVLNEGVVYNKQSDGSWKSPNETISANQLLTKVDESLGWSKNLLSMDEFKNFKGTVGQSNVNNDGENNNNPLIKNLTEVKDNQVIQDVQVGTGVFGLGEKTSNIKKINGVFYVQKPYDYSANPEFIKANPEQLKFIKTQYK